MRYFFEGIYYNTVRRRLTNNGDGGLRGDLSVDVDGLTGVFAGVGGLDIGDDELVAAALGASADDGHAFGFRRGDDLFVITVAEMEKKDVRV